MMEGLTNLETKMTIIIYQEEEEKMIPETKIIF
jgi:hypothetical protein